MSSNQVIAEHPLYNVYIYVSETLLRLGPIVTLTILNILIIVRFNRIAKKREHLKGPAVHRTPTNKNTIQRSVSPIACVTDQVHSNGNNGNLLAVPSTNGNPPVISVDHVRAIFSLVAKFVLQSQGQLANECCRWNVSKFVCFSFNWATIQSAS